MAKKKNEIELSILVPTFNEDKDFEKTLIDIRDYIKKLPFESEVIITDSNSTNGTIKLVKKYAKEIDHLSYTEPKDKSRMGKGQGIQDGIAAARGKYIMFMDADSSTKVAELDDLLPYREKYDIVMGSRYIKEPRPYKPSYFWALFHGIKSVLEVLIFGHSRDYVAKGRQGRIRQFISRGGNLAFTVLLNQSYVDQRCGFKLYKKDVAKHLAGLQLIFGFGFDTEYLAIAQKYKYKTIEIPVDWYDDATGTRINPIKDSINSFKDIFKVQLNILKRKYSKKRVRKDLSAQYESFTLND